MAKRKTNRDDDDRMDEDSDGGENDSGSEGVSLLFHVLRRL